jgi:hypothetical protein
MAHLAARGCAALPAGSHGPGRSPSADLRDQAVEREKQLQEQINQLLRALGPKEGELEALRKPKPKGF